MRSLKARAALLTAVALVLSGCGGASTDTDAASAPAAEHTMADGEVMAGHEHSAGSSDGEAEHEGGHGSGHGADHDSAAGPSGAAQMICEPVVQKAVKRLVDGDYTGEPARDWRDGVLTCSYDVSGGSLVLSVHDAPDETIGRTHFDATTAATAGAKAIRGIASHGLPAFQTSDGRAFFLKDGKTLTVDATGLPARIGQFDYTREHLAYAVASVVIACWVQHPEGNGESQG